MCVCSSVAPSVEGPAAALAAGLRGVEGGESWRMEGPASCSAAALVAGAGRAAAAVAGCGAAWGLTTRRDGTVLRRTVQQHNQAATSEGGKVAAPPPSEHDCDPRDSQDGQLDAAALEEAPGLRRRPRRVSATVAAGLLWGRPQQGGAAFGPALPAVGQP